MDACPINADSLMRETTMRIEVRKVGRLKARLRIAIWLMRLAAWVLGPKAEVEVTL